MKKIVVEEKMVEESIQAALGTGFEMIADMGPGPLFKHKEESEYLAILFLDNSTEFHFFGEEDKEDFIREVIIGSMDTEDKAVFSSMCAIAKRFPGTADALFKVVTEAATKESSNSILANL